MNPFHFFTRAAVEEFEKRFTQFLVHNPIFQSFAHHSSKKAKELSSKVCVYYIFQKHVSLGK
jgi:hypothetical protein